jgi:hypothetical protein
MLTVTILIQRRLTQAIRRTLSIPSSPVNQILSSFYFLCTKTPESFPDKILDSKEEKPSCLSYRIEKLPMGESAGSSVQSWKFPKKMLESKEEEKPSCLSYMIEKLAKGESVGSAFQSWMGRGFPIHRGEIFHAINRLRKLKMNKRALEVSLSLSLGCVWVKCV